MSITAESHKVTIPQPRICRSACVPDIVYCRECMYRDKASATCDIADYTVGPNDYCSKGDRRQEGTGAEERA